MVARGVLQYGGVCTIFAKPVNNRLSESLSKSLAMTIVHVCCASYLYIRSVGLTALKKECQPVITGVCGEASLLNPEKYRIMIDSDHAMRAVHIELSYLLAFNSCK